jgi:hypothetical protein
MEYGALNLDFDLIQLMNLLQDLIQLKIYLLILLLLISHPMYLFIFIFRYQPNQQNLIYSFLFTLDHYL